MMYSGLSSDMFQSWLKYVHDYDFPSITDHSSGSQSEIPTTSPQINNCLPFMNTSFEQNQFWIHKFCFCIHNLNVNYFVYALDICRFPCIFIYFYNNIT